MKSLALALLALVYIGHWPIQSLTGIDATVIFYITRGILGMVLFAMCVKLSILTAWRWICYLGMILEASTVVGGFMFALDGSYPPEWQGLIDYQTGLPSSWLVIAALAILAGAFEYESRHEARRRD